MQPLIWHRVQQDPIGLQGLPPRRGWPLHGVVSGGLHEKAYIHSCDNGARRWSDFDARHCPGQGYGWHRHADQIIGALDFRRQFHGRSVRPLPATATDLQYAEDDIPNQLAQIENMITKGVDVLVIAAIDGTTLSNALENAAASRHQGHRL
jgi:hypothetical protein